MTEPDRHVDLSHRIAPGMETYPGLPTPEVHTHLSRQQAEAIYGPGTSFHIAVVTLCSNTGTYLDVPFHRYADGHDLTDLDLRRVAAVPAVRVDAVGVTAIDVEPEAAAGWTDRAVLFHTGHARHWGGPAYAREHPHLTAAAAEVLAGVGVACVGIDSLNIDSTATGDRPVHSTLLRAEIPIVEHLTNLEQLPGEGFRFTAVPPKIEGVGTYTVRAFATLAGSRPPG